MNIFSTIRFRICFGCSKEPSHWDGSFEYSQHMFRLRNKKTNFCHALLSEGMEKEIQFDAEHKRIDKIGYLFFCPCIWSFRLSGRPVYSVAIFIDVYFSHYIRLYYTFMLGIVYIGHQGEHSMRVECWFDNDHLVRASPASLRCVLEQEHLF